MESIQTPHIPGQGGKVLAILGPTASGKTSLAISIAKEFSGEVISLDSRQIYRGLDIGTEKVTSEEMGGVPHHLIDIADPTEVVTVKEIQKRARVCISDIIARGNLPILAGGTGMYFDAVLYDISFPEVKPNKALRAELEKHSTEELLEMLSNKDPRRTETIDTQNRRRIVRALEIVEELGAVPAPKHGPLVYDALILGLKVDREILKERIHSRLSNTMQKGLIEETRWLMNTVDRNRVDEFGLEYRIVASYIEGDISEGEMEEKLTQSLTQYAKRQMTWFKRNKDIAWVNPEKYEEIKGLVTSHVS